MSYRTNRRTGGIFRTRDYSPAELESQSRRYTCPRCEAMLGSDVSPATANLSARMSGHETAGTPLASFISKAELNEHIRIMHPGQRLPTKTHRRIGRSITVNMTQTNSPDTITAPSTETKEEMAETEGTGDVGVGSDFEATEDVGDAGAGNEGFTDDDGQIFDGQGGLLD